MQRLLPKQEINRLRKEEERQRMEEGMRIANRVDSLREIASTEEQAFEQYRTTSLTGIQAEIDAKKEENERLATANKALQEERTRLEAPIDLQKAWKEVNERGESNEIISDSILSREVEVLKRENDVEEAKKELSWKERDVATSEAAARTNLTQAEEQRNEAEIANKEAQSIFLQMQEQQRRENEQHDSRKNDLKEREEALLLREEELERETLVINSEKILLADRRATLERGFAELRRKTNT